MFVSSWILKFYVQKKRICGTFAEQHKTTQAGTAFLPGYILFSGSLGWLMEVKCLETACFPLFPSFPNIMRNCEFLHSPTWTVVFFFFLFSLCKSHLYESTTHLTHESYNSKREGQAGRRGTMSVSTQICQVQLTKLDKKRNDEAEDRRLYQYPCINSLAETVCHLVVCWPPKNTILKTVKTWRI